jgi:hypothetical protein
MISPTHPSQGFAASLRITRPAVEYHLYRRHHQEPHRRHRHHLTRRPVPVGPRTASTTACMLPMATVTMVVLAPSTRTACSDAIAPTAAHAWDHHLRHHRTRRLHHHQTHRHRLRQSTATLARATRCLRPTLLPRLQALGCTRSVLASRWREVATRLRRLARQC